MKKLKLIKLVSDSNLTNESMNKLRGGDSNCCCCGCQGSSSNESNYNANTNSGYGCSNGHTTYGCSS